MPVMNGRDTGHMLCADHGAATKPFLRKYSKRIDSYPDNTGVSRRQPAIAKDVERADARTTLHDRSYTTVHKLLRSYAAQVTAKCIPGAGAGGSCVPMAESEIDQLTLSQL